MKSARANWEEVVLVCRKCSKKVDGGFGPKGKTSLRKALRKELHLKKGRRARVGVVEADCLKLCPKDAVTVVLGSEPGQWRKVPRGADIKEVAAELGLVAATETPSDTAAPTSETSR
jgi:predicted metal-binding protein